MYQFPPIKKIRELYPLIIQKAQNEYDNWEQDEDGFDEINGAGGICHHIADSMVSVISSSLDKPDNYVFVETKSVSDVQHVNVLIAVEEGIYELDIPYSIYEEGGGFTWIKKPDVIFSINDIAEFRLEVNLENIQNYTENDDLDNYLKSIKKHEDDLDKKTETKLSIF